MFTNPLSMPPGAIIGYRKNGSPIHPIAGGSEPAVEPPATPPAPAAEPQPTPVAVPPVAPASAPAAPEAQPQSAGSVDELPAWAQKHLKELRTEAAASRTKAKEVAESLDQFRAEQAQQRQAFAKALGLAPDEPPTVEQLTQQLAASQAQQQAESQRARQTAVELAVLRAAASQQVDGNALLDSRAFISGVESLDPAAADFQQQVSAAIATAAEQNGRYQLAQATPPPPAPPAPPSIPKSGAEFSAPPQGPRQWTDQDVANASPKQVQDAINQGLLRDLGFGEQRGTRR